VDFFAHICELPPIPSPPIKVEIRGAPRHNAKAKDSNWVRWGFPANRPHHAMGPHTPAGRDRKWLEDLKPPDVNELVLRNEDGLLLEGTQTNFYAIMDGTVRP
jgi:hypothetical protein